MIRNTTGEYEKNKRVGANGFYFYTFTPRPLMSGDFFAVDAELSALLVSAHRELGILQGIMSHLPDRDIIYKLLVTIECYYSRQIDYSDASFSTILKALK